MKSFWKLRLEQLSNTIHFIIISLILLAISLRIPYLYPLYLGYLFYYLKKTSPTRLAVFLTLFFNILLFISYYFPLTYHSASITGLVLEKKENKIVLLRGLSKYAIYTKEDLIPGDYVKLQIRRMELKTPSYPGDFDFRLYLRSNDYNNAFKLLSYEKINHFKTLGYLREKILSYYRVRMDSDYFNLFKALVFGLNDIDEEITNSMSRLNLMHILALSGFHLNLIALFIYKLMLVITKRDYLSERVALFIVSIYSLFCGLKISIFRALIFMLLKYINYLNKGILTKLDLFSLTFLILMLKPMRIFSISFILSFLASFIILFLDDFISTTNPFKPLISGFIILLWTFPFITNINNTLSIFSLLSFFLMDFYSYFFIPLCFSFLIAPRLSYSLSFINQSFNYFLENLSNYLVISFPYMRPLIKLLYYLTLIIILVSLSRKKLNKVGVLFFIIVLGLFKLGPHLSQDYLEFIDVGQGDTCYIRTKGEGFLIDCYNVSDFLKKKDIRSLDSIFITHSDNDHMGDLAKVIDNLEVKNVYINAFDLGIDNLFINDKRLKKLKKGDRIKIGEALITVLAPEYDLKEKNSNSLVLDIKMLNKSFLFMGDATVKTEEFLINSNSLDTYYLLKVGHHGSITSTSEEFLAYVRPSVAVISLGVNNYGMPNHEVLERLAKYSRIYITHDSGNIKYLHRGIKTYNNICYN